MPLRLEIISHQRVRLGERRLQEFGIKGGTIGRSLESDWALEDSNRYLSGRHAAIDYRSGSYYIVDTSTNGVYVNDSTTPIGRAKPQRLFHGDRLRLGEYVMLVHLEDSAEDEIFGNAAHVDPVERANLADSPTLTGYTLLSEAELSVLAVEEILEDDSAASALKAAAEEAALNLKLIDEPDKPDQPRDDGPSDVDAAASIDLSPPAIDEPKRTPAAREAASAAPADSTDDGAAAQTALYAFFRGAGLPSRALSDRQSALLLHRAGQLVRELAIGLRKAVETRVEHRNSMRLANTTIQPRDNNLLKFSPSAEDALEKLFFLEKAEYLGAVEAAREVFDETISHERALLEATRSALAAYLEQLDPEEVQAQAGEAAKRGLLSGVTDAKFRQRYEAVYASLAEHAPGQLPQRFADAFAQAYERELSKADSTRKRTSRSQASNG